VVHALERSSAKTRTHFVIGGEVQLAAPTAYGFHCMQNGLKQVRWRAATVMPVARALGSRHSLVPGFEGAEMVAFTLPHFTQQQPC
jgi:hypothetical protein